MAGMAQAKRRTIRGSKTGRPIMVLLDLMGRRWTLRIIWELRGEALTSRALRERCDDISPTVLQTRVGELREAPDDVVCTDGDDDGADQAADQRVRRRRWDAQPPGSQVPDDGTDQAAEQD